MATIYILNTDLEVIGSLSNDTPNSTPFYDDLHSTKIAENNEKIWSETLSFKVPSQYEEAEYLTRGNYLLSEEQGTGRYKLFYIEEVSETINGKTHLKSVDIAYNAFISHLRNYTYIPEPKTFNPAITTDIIKFLTAGSQWSIESNKNLYLGSAKTFTVQEGNALSSMDEFTRTFGVELEAYVEVKNGKIIDKKVEFYKQIGEQENMIRFEYSRDLVGATRRYTNNDFATMLYVYGMTNDKGVQKGITSVNKIKDPETGVEGNMPFIYDSEANDLHNEGLPFIKKKIVNETLGTPESILAWGKEQLKYYNHPKYEYTIDVALFRNEVGLGDVVEVVDFEMTPPMTIQARVIQTDFSLTNPRSNKVTLGEFKEIEVKTIGSMEALKDQVDKLTNTYKPTYTIDEVTNKLEAAISLKVIVREDGLRMILENDAYSWKRYSKDGELDEVWSSEHEGVGDTLIITNEEYSTYEYFCDVVLDDFTHIERADFRQAMSKFIKKANKYIKDDSIVLAFITDSHYDNDTSYSYEYAKMGRPRSLSYCKNVVELSQQIKLDAIIHGGDFVDGRKDDKDLTKINLDSAIGVFKDAKAPRIFCRGNHDNNYLFYGDGGKYADRYNPNKVISNADMKKIISQFWAEDGVATDDKDGVYGYFDVPNKNTRIIFLDSIELFEDLDANGKRRDIVRHLYAFKPTQVQWFADTLIGTPKDRDIIIATHVSLTKKTGSADERVNADAIIQVINAWRLGGTHTISTTRQYYGVNFTKNFGAAPTGKLIMHLAGHNHKDTAQRSSSYDGKIPSFTRTSPFPLENNYQTTRKFDTLEETAFDLIIINKANTTVRFLRYGFNATDESFIINYNSTFDITKEDPSIDEEEFENE